MFSALMPGKKKYGRGENPKSWEHAKHNKGRPKFEDKWGEKSVTSGISVSRTALNNLKVICKEAGFTGHSEVLQYIGMELIPLLIKDIDYEAATKALEENGFNSINDFLIALTNQEIEIVQKQQEIQ